MDSFDYIIVGAGSAGCVLANRLSADPGRSVCLIEAGPVDKSLLIHVPIGIVPLLNHPQLNWRHATIAQAYSDGRSIPIPRGRVLGGSSSINGMVYMRGHPLDYDDWEKAGNADWSYAKVLPYFIRSENNLKWRDSPFHGTGGELSVVDPSPVNGMIGVFFNAARAQGIPKTEDFNGLSQEGYGIRQLTQRRGRRESTATAFLSPARGRPNLRIVTDALVNRVILEGRRAVGIEYNIGGEARRLSARKEVILAAGVIGSPLILNRSGIGAADDLRPHGIDVVHELPGLGKNFQDHIAVDINYSSPRPISVGLSLPALPRLVWGTLKFILGSSGFPSAMPMDSGAFVRSSGIVDRPDIQLIFAAVNRPPSGRIGIGHGYGMTPLVLRPRSTGFVKLSSADPMAEPIIDPKFFSDEADLDLLLKGVRLSISILEDPAFSSYRGEEFAPGKSVRTDDELRNFIRSSCHTAYHPVGTCKMGNDTQSVVDATLRVHGMDALRVVDASIMPTIIGGNTNAPTIMIAEKAADMILGKTPAAAALHDSK